MLNNKQNGILPGERGVTQETKQVRDFGDRNDNQNHLP